MATIFIPSMLQSLTGGAKQVDCDARNVRQVIERLEAAEVTVYRTDRDGDVRLVIRPDGSLTADSSR